MAWQQGPRTASSGRTGRTEWRKLRTEVLQRDGHQCMIRGPRCTINATEVDHIIPVSLGGQDEPTNCQSACRPCHSWKTAREAARARRRSHLRKPYPHIGMLP